MKIEWLDLPEEHDYPAAMDYLSLIFSDTRALVMCIGLRNAPMCSRRAKDILRASGERALPPENCHVHSDLQKMKKGKSLSPVLLVQAPLQLVIADGYHRVCAAYSLDENAVIPCKLIGSQAQA